VGTELKISPTPGLKVCGFCHGERRRKPGKKVAMVLAIGHALRAHEALGRSDALSGFLQVIHRLFEDGLFVGHELSIRTSGGLRSLDAFVICCENPFMFRDAMLKLLAETLPYAKLIAD
jgi:hypothetical protein